jgi:hypothetical protein
MSRVKKIKKKIKEVMLKFLGLLILKDIFIINLILNKILGKGFIDAFPIPLRLF